MSVVTTYCVLAANISPEKVSAECPTIRLSYLTPCCGDDENRFIVPEEDILLLEFAPL